jgi:iron complex transport system permease protein
MYWAAMTLMGMGLVVAHMAWGAVGWEEMWSRGLGEEILWGIRLPRVLMAMTAGAGLGVSGLMMQTWFQNPLAGPSVLGITSGAARGVAVVVMTGGALGLGALGWGGTVVAASAGSLAVLVLIAWMARRFRGVMTLLIFGLMLGYTVGAVVTVLQREARQEALQQFVFWGMGSLSQTTLYISLIAGGIVLVGVGVLWKRWRFLDAWTLGEWTAKSMGVPVARLRREVLWVTGIVTGGVTALCGPLAFLGLATPHVVRFVSSSKASATSHRSAVPRVAAMGAVLALLADFFVRAPWSADGGWPLNAVLSLLGAPVVMVVVLRKSWEA